MTKLGAAAGRINLRYSRKAVIRAFEKWKRLAPLKNGASSALETPEADMAAEAAFTQLDQDLKKRFQYRTAQHRDRKDVAHIVARHKLDTKKATAWFDRLQQVIDAYQSPRWTTIARARQGDLYHDLRMRLLDTGPGNLFHKKKTSELRFDVELVAVHCYAMAVITSRRYNITHPAKVQAVRRLAEVVGDAKMKAHMSGVDNLRYRRGMFVRIRPGLTSIPEASGITPPLPIANH